MFTLIKHKQSSGFTLIEVAIVLVIVGLIIGALIAPLGAQREAINVKQARQELKMIEEALLGYVIANDRLPCPASGVTAGIEDPAGGGACNTPRGFIPATTLGISGRYNCDNLLIDPWGNPYRYSVTTVNGNAFTTSISAISPLSLLTPNLNICDASGCANTLTTDAVAVIYSMGKNWATFTSADETENGETTIPGSGCGFANYNVSNDNRYVHRESVEIAGSEYDDIVIWLSPNTIYAKLLAAGVL